MQKLKKNITWKKKKPKVYMSTTWHLLCSCYTLRCMLPDLLWIIMTFGYDNWVFNSKKVFLEKLFLFLESN